MPSHWPKGLILLAATLVAGPAGAGASVGAGDADDRATYERIRSLAGSWTGRMEDPLAGDPVAVRYEVVSNGRAVIEFQNPGKTYEMATVYFLASGKLKATHYCAAGNQPSWRLSKLSTADVAVLEFDGGTGFDKDHDGHVHQGEIRFVSEDRIEERWDHFVGPKAQGSTHWFLERVKPASGETPAASSEPEPKPASGR